MALTIDANDDSGDFLFSFYSDFAPHIGHKVTYQGQLYEVTDVVWDVSVSGVVNNVTVTLTE